MNVNRVQHVSVPVPPGGADQVRWFYGDVLGIPEKAVPKELDAARLTWFEVGDDEHEIHCFVDDDYQNRSTGAHLCLQVEDLELTRSQLTDAGVEITDTIAIHNRPRFFARDPFGNLVEFAEIRGPYQEA